MKKVMLVVLLLLVAMTLIACGSDDNTTPDPSSSSTPGVSDTPGVTSTAPVTSDDPDAKVEKTEDYTAVLRDFDWVSDEIDYGSFQYFGSGSAVANDINKDYGGYVKNFYLVGEDGNKTSVSSAEVRRLSTVGVTIEEDKNAKTLTATLYELDVRVESSWERVTARAGSYLMFSFTTNCPTGFYMTVTTSPTSTTAAYEQGGVTVAGSNGRYTGTAKCTVPYRAGETYSINICLDNAEKTVLASIPVEITTAKYDSQYALMFQGDWELIRDEEYLPNLVDLFYNVYPRLYARFAYGTEPKTITFMADKNYDGVAYCAGTTVCVSTAYANSNPNDLGFFSHEITHSVQQYSMLNYGGDAWWTENMANYGGFRYFHWGYSTKFVQIYNMDDKSLQDWGYQAYGNNKVFFAYLDYMWPTTENEDGTLKYGLIDSINRMIKDSTVMLNDNPKQVGSTFNNKVKEVTGYDTIEAIRLKYVDDLNNGVWEFVGFRDYVDNFLTEDIEGVPNPTYPMREDVTKGDKTNTALATPVTEGTNLAKGATVIDSSGQTSDQYGVDKAFDGDLTTKWMVKKGASGDQKYELGGYQHSITIDLGEEKTFNTYTLVNAGVRENKIFNTKEWEVLISSDGETWTSIDYQKDMNVDTVSFNVGEQTARYVMLRVYAADNNNIGTIRIYDFMLFDQ